MIRRLLWMLVVLWSITVVVFLLWKMVPGDPARAVLGLDVTEEHVATLRREMGLDKPILVQYYRYVARLWRLDLGRSYLTQQPVNKDIARLFPATLELSLVTMLVYVAVAVPLGVVSAVRKGKLTDLMVRVLVTSGAGAPAFWLALLLQLAFYYHLGWLPSTGRFDLGLAEPTRITGLFTVDSLLTGNFHSFAVSIKHLVLPVSALVVSRLAVGVKITRASMLETLSRDFVRTARSKGLSERSVMYRHALRNALIPVVTTLGIQFSYLLGGTVVIETVFVWPGLGRYAVGSITALDIPAILGVTLVASLIFVLINLFVDMMYAGINPQIRFE